MVPDMSKRHLYITALCLVLIAGLFNRYIELEYGMSLFERVIGSNRLSEHEKKWLQEHGALIYGADKNSPPLRFIDESGPHRGMIIDSDGFDNDSLPLRFIDETVQQHEGLVVDYIKALAVELETNIEFKPLVWKDALASLAKGEIDICDMYPSPERADDFLFSEPIYNIRGVVLIPNGAQDITHYADLKHKIVGVPEGDYVIEFLKAHVEGIQFELALDMLHALQLLQEGKVQAVAGNEPVISHFLGQFGVKARYSFLAPPLYENNNVLAVPKAEKTLLNIINKGIRNLKRKNSMEKIQQKWFGISAPFSKENTSDKIVLLTMLFLMIIFLAVYLLFSWNTLLKHEVEKRTEELFNSKTNLQTTFDGLTYFMVVIDSAFNIVTANKAFCSFVKAEQSTVIGRQYKDFGGILSNMVNQQAIADTFSHAAQRRHEFEFQAKSLKYAPFR